MMGIVTLIVEDLVNLNQTYISLTITQGWSIQKVKLSFTVVRFFG